MLKLAACCLGVFFIIACGRNVNLNDNSNGISVTGSDGTVYNSYQTACSKGDFDAARDYVGKMKEQLIAVASSGSYSEREALEEAIQEAEKYVENEEFQFLASLNEEQANKRIILMLNQRPVDGLVPVENYSLGKNVYEGAINNNYSYSPDELKKFKEYVAWCGNYNSQCTSLLNIAIACGNKSLAQKLLNVFRPDPEMILKKSGKESFDVYAHYTNSSKAEAQKKYDEAVKSGAFN